MPGESVVYRARLHWIVYAWAAAFGGSGVLLLSVLSPAIAAGAFALGAFAGLAAYVESLTSEFAVTDRRVIMKVGWLRRRSLETLLGKVEAIAIEQGIVGRLLGYGTIGITGTGGTREEFRGIAAPLEFRTEIQTQIGVSIGLPARATDDHTGVVHSPRDERECPYCAEWILARARVCRHCGRDVAPLA